MVEKRAISDFLTLTGIAFGIFIGLAAVENAIDMHWQQNFSEEPWHLIPIFYSWLAVISFPFLFCSYLPLNRKWHFLLTVIFCLFFCLYCFEMDKGNFTTCLSITALIYFPLHFIYTPCKNFILRKRAQKVAKQA